MNLAPAGRGRLSAAERVRGSAQKAIGSTGGTRNLRPHFQANRQALPQAPRCSALQVFLEPGDGAFERIDLVLALEEAVAFAGVEVQFHRAAVRLGK